MIRTEREYRETLKRIDEGQQVIERQLEALQGRGLSPEQIEAATVPLRAFQAELSDEATRYEAVRCGAAGPFRRLSDLGRFLIELRIAGGLTQRELAERLGVAESQVSRDERHEYYGIGIERAQAIIDALADRTDTRVSLQARATDRPGRSPQPAARSPRYL